VRVNGIEFRQVSLRPRDGHGAKCEVVIRDRHLGSFALHEGFVLEVLEAEEEDPRWRHVSLLELSKTISIEVQSKNADFGCDTYLDSSLGRYYEKHLHGPIERIPVEGDAGHLDRLHTALIEAQIRYRIVGGLDNCGRSWGHLTLAVSPMARAGMCLRRAGFLESSESQYVLIDSRTGWKVRLLEVQPARSR
jgi:hypothetical protein